MKRTKKELLNGITKEVRESKIIANNTLRISYADGSNSIRLHNTDIVTFLTDGTIQLNSGGWRTITTKDRISTYSGLRIWREKGLWYVNGGKLFYDNMILTKDGELVSPAKTANLDKIEKVKKQITKFVSKITKDNLPLPNSGDCWYCSLKTSEGQTMGELGTGNNEHLLQHVKEGYLHGSLLVNAMLETGYQNDQIGFHYQLKLADTFKRALRKYLQKRLIKDIAVK